MLPTTTLTEMTAALKCGCGAEAYPTPTGSQCAAYSDHKFVVDQSDPEWSDAYRRDWQTHMTPVWAAWKLGYLAAASGSSESANPYLRPGESPTAPSYPIANGWQCGWLNGQGCRAEDVETAFAEWKSRR